MLCPGFHTLSPGGLWFHHCCHPGPSSHRERLVRLNTGSSTIHAIMPWAREPLTPTCPWVYQRLAPAVALRLTVALHTTEEEHFLYASIGCGFLCMPSVDDSPPFGILCSALHVTDHALGLQARQYTAPLQAVGSLDLESWLPVSQSRRV